MNDYLAHYGVLGMKWGVRRYRNKDGSRTAEGKRRRKREYSKDYEETKTLRKKKASELSNEELKKVTKRLQLEQNYKQLNPSIVKRGIKALGTVSSVAGTIGGVYAIKNSAYVKDGAKFIKSLRG